jgi:hypothetical protein
MRRSFVNAVFFGSLLSLILLQVSCIEATTRRASLYCPNDDIDPTIREILDAAIPWKDLSLHQISVDDIVLNITPEEYLPPAKTILSWKNTILNIRPTFLLWLTLGRYIIKFDENTNPHWSFNDIHIVQESHFRHNPLCSLAMPKGIPVVSSICHCEEKYQLANSDWSKFGAVLDLNKQDKSKWCVRKAPCTSRDMASGLCEIYTDPARRSCLLIEHNKVDTIWKEVEESVGFNMSIPKLKLLLPTGWVKRYSFEYERIGKEHVAKVLDHIPFYLFNLLVGLFIMYFSRDLAEDGIFQAIIQGMIGIFFGLFMLMFVCQK